MLPISVSNSVLIDANAGHRHQATHYCFGSYQQYDLLSYHFATDYRRNMTYSTLSDAMIRPVVDTIQDTLRFISGYCAKKPSKVAVHFYAA
ncbi:hypothetical protein INT44_007047 [Umbelopsis vinacea]|uniref:Uncharacterized protein n=1 Tax=Umbelopsis vinacea TaxID=44442 RepID=A0A8H7PG80_9FUNG|nr:hypothetical protein INT44_007047 [Umbelopsis vinacea]